MSVEGVPGRWGLARPGARSRCGGRAAAADTDKRLLNRTLAGCSVFGPVKPEPE